MPEGEELLGNAQHQQQQVRDGQAEEVVVGGRVHVLVSRNDDASADVALLRKEKEKVIGEVNFFLPLLPLLLLLGSGLFACLFLSL